MYYKKPQQKISAKCGKCKSKLFAEIEKLHGEDNWSLDTIMQEEGNIYLYEKVGYHQTGEIEHIKDGMDIVFFEKN